MKNTNNAAKRLSTYNQLLGQMLLLIRQNINTMPNKSQKEVHSVVSRFKEVSGKLLTRYEKLLSDEHNQLMASRAANALFRHEFMESNSNGPRLTGSTKGSKKVIHNAKTDTDSSVDNNQSSSSDVLFTINGPTMQSKSSDSSLDSSSESSSSDTTYHFKHLSSQPSMATARSDKKQTKPKFNTNTTIPADSTRVPSVKIGNMSKARTKSPDLNKDFVNDGKDTNDDNTVVTNTAKESESDPKQKKTGVRHLLHGLQRFLTKK